MTARYKELIPTTVNKNSEHFSFILLQIHQHKAVFSDLASRQGTDPFILVGMESLESSRNYFCRFETGHSSLLKIVRRCYIWWLYYRGNNVTSIY